MNLSSFVIGILLLMLVGCGQPDPALSAQQTPDVLGGIPGTPTVLEDVTDTPTATPTLTAAEEDATIAADDARRQHDLATVEAGGVLPTPVDAGTPIGFRPPGEPAFEIRLGITGDCADPNPTFAYAGCWTGEVDGAYLFVDAGALKADYLQGVVRVYTSTLDLEDQSDPVLYPTPRRSGLVFVAADLFPQLRLQAQDGTVYLFNVLTRTYEQTIAPPVLTPLPPTPEPYVIDLTELPFADEPPTLPPAPTLPPTTEAAMNAASACDLYPLALQRATVDAARPGQTIRDLPSGQARGNLGWLSWIGEETTTALLEALTAPGTGGRSTNPDNPNDHRLSVGDRVRSHPGATDQRSVRDALDRLRGATITVPVWDTADRVGGTLQYHIVGFARIQLVDYKLSGSPRFSIRSLEAATCDG
jgi:hypothetical protein